MTEKNRITADSIHKKEFFKQNLVLYLVIIGCIGFIIRLIFLPLDVPLVSDAFWYFGYASDLKNLGSFPTGYHLVNNGWPTFLSFVFSFFEYNEFLQFMNIQRILSIILSSMTVIPVYFLCRKFFSKSLSIIGGAIFVFEPRIIINSLLGITEPLYIILITSALSLFLSQNKKLIFLSFPLLSLAILVRYEGIMWVLIFSIMYFIFYKNKINAKIIGKYLLLIGIFVLILTPMLYVRTITTGTDQISTRIQGSIEDVDISTSGGENKILSFMQYLGNGIVNLLKNLSWSMIPYLIFFVPAGAYFLLKKRNFDSLVLIVSIISILSTNVLYAYSRGIQDTRYLYVLYPIFCIFALFTIQKMLERTERKKMISVLLLSGILISSIVFLNFKSIDVEHERESFIISKKIYEITKVTNQIYPESQYIEMSSLLEMDYPFLINSVEPKMHLVDTTKYDSLQDLIIQNKKITHIITDNSKNRPEYLRDLFSDENKYQFLTKVYDSQEQGYKYHVKVFKIDFKKFDT